MAMDAFNALIAATRADYDREAPYVAQDAEDRLAWIGAKHVVVLVETATALLAEIDSGDPMRSGSVCNEARLLLAAIERDAKGEC